MKKTHLILFLIFTYYSFISGIRDCFPQSQFQLVIGDSSNTAEARSIIQTTDGGFIAVGRNYWPGGDMYIVKLNSSGQLQWSKTIGGTGIALSVLQTTEGGFAVAGFGSSYGAGVSGPFIVKLTPGGAVEWVRLLVDGFGGAAYSIVQTLDGGFAAAISNPDGGGTYSMIVVKLNNMGIIQWSKNIGSVSYVRCIKQTTDGGYILAGAKGGPALDMFIVKLDSIGTLLWAKTIGGPDDDFAYSVVQTIDDGYAVAGWTYSFGSEKMYIAKLDSSGMLQWTKVFAVNGDRAYSIVQTIDGGYALAGYTGWGGGMLILKLNPDGSLQWSRVVDCGTGQMYTRSILQTSDGGYVAAGFGGIWGSTGIFIVKLDNNGNTCSNTVSHNISVDSGGILNSHIPSVTDFFIMDTLVTPQTGTYGYVTTLCVIGIQPISSEIPDSYKMYQNYPNPFNPVTNIRFDIPNDLNVSIRIYDIRGREVFSINEYKKAGSYEVQFDGTNFASGMYFYQIETDGFTETKKMVLLK